MRPNALRELREQKKLTQEYVATYLGTTTQYYQKYEKGLHPLPTDRLKKLCLLYNVTADYILGLPKGLEWPQ